MKLRFVLWAVIIFFLNIPVIAKVNQPVQLSLSKEFKQNILHAPLDFSAAGLAFYLKNIYNLPEYRDLLSHDLSHLTQFLQHGKKSNQQLPFVKETLRLFSNKIKSCYYINGESFCQCAETLPDLLQNYFAVPEISPARTLNDTINQMMYSTFLSRFDEFKKSPSVFLEDLTLQIVDLMKDQYEKVDELLKEDVRKVLLLFLETSINKLVWSPVDQEESWLCVKRIAQTLSTLVDHNVIADLDDLNSLYICLIERYCYFLEIAGHELTLDVYEKIRHDIGNQSLLLFDLEEQEQFIETKAARLMRTLIECETKIHAQARGIVIR